MATTFHWLNRLRLEGALRRVTTDFGVAASDWSLFRGAVFGRDSLIVAHDLLETHPALVRRIVLGLARLQGDTHEPLTEEEPGKIHHEHRTLFHNGRPLGPAAARLVAQIARERSIGSDAGFTYYGSVDATVQYVRLINAYARRYGPSILEERFTHKSGTECSVRESMLAATAWTAGQLERSDLGLLEFRRTNPQGQKWHVLRDGCVSYVHADGNLANTQAPVASLEVQGLAYDAMLDASDLFPEHRDAPAWRALADRLRLHTLLLFWMREPEYFAMGIDRDSVGRPRHLEVVTAMPAELLDTRFFDNLPAPYDRRRLLEPIVRRLYSRQLMTPVGPRMRSLEHTGVLPYADYQGTGTSWPVITGIIARGLRRQGLRPLARDLEQRLLRSIDVLRDCPEFFYVDASGRPAVRSHRGAAGRREIAAVSLPERNQAWTISAAIRAMGPRPSGRPPRRWEARLSAEVLAALPEDSRIIQPVRLFVNQSAGRASEAGYLARQGYAYELETAPWLQPA